MREYIGIHLFERSVYYNQATYTINVDGKSPDEIVREIKDLLL
jgi:shikimate kinase